MKTHFDYEAIYLMDGILYYIFQAGTGPGILQSANPLNDGRWHTIETSRAVKYKDDDKKKGVIGVDGTLIIDGDEVVTGRSKGAASQVNNVKYIYMGGVPKGQLQPSAISKNSRFIGGITDIEHLKEKPDLVKSVGSGFVNGFKAGLDIGPNGGYGSVTGIPEVGRDFSFRMRISSRYRRGYLLYVKTKSDQHADFLAVHIKEDGSVVAECDNGGGSFSVSVKPSQDLCDGQMHEIQGIKKGTELTLLVDNSDNSVSSPSAQSAANTGKEPFYFGGVPAGERPKGYQPFSGCIESVVLQNKEINMADLKLKGEAVPGCGKK